MIALHTYNEKMFLVPFGWLQKKVKTIYESTVKDFLNEYTWDDSFLIFQLAMVDGLVNC